MESRTMLSDEEMVAGRNMHHTASDSAPLSVYFLIANARLEFRLSHRKDSPLKISNRERIAILRLRSHGLARKGRRTRMCLSTMRPRNVQSRGACDTNNGRFSSDFPCLFALALSFMPLTFRRRSRRNLPHRGEQRLGVRMLRCGKYVLGCTDLHEPASLHHGHARRQL